MCSKKLLLMVSAFILTLPLVANAQDFEEKNDYSYSQKYEGIGSQASCQEQAVSWSTTKMFESLELLAQGKTPSRRVLLDLNQEQTLAVLNTLEGVNWHQQTIVCNQEGWSKTNGAVANPAARPDLSPEGGAINTLLPTGARDECLANLMVLPRVEKDIVKKGMHLVLSQDEHGVDVQVRNNYSDGTFRTVHAWCQGAQPTSETFEGKQAE